MWWLYLTIFILGMTYSYIAIHNGVVMAIHYAGHVWFDKPKEPLADRAQHLLWIIVGGFWGVMFISFAILEGFRLGS